MDQEYIGIDVSKDQLDVAAYVSKKQWQFFNNDSGIGQLLSTLKPSGVALVVVESTGRV
jgi:transposase